MPRASSPSSLISRPSTKTCPVVGRSSPPRICSKVVLPDPEAPTIAIRSPAPAAKFTPRSTSSVTGPCVKFFCTSRASNTNSLMSESLGRRGPRCAPRRINRRHSTQQEGNGARAHDVQPLDVRWQITHVVDARIQEMGTERTYKRGNQGLQVVGEHGSEAGAEKCADEADHYPLDGECGENVGWAGTKGA